MKKPRKFVTTTCAFVRMSMVTKQRRHSRLGHSDFAATDERIPKKEKKSMCTTRGEFSHDLYRALCLFLANESNLHTVLLSRGLEYSEKAVLHVILKSNSL